MLPRRGLLRRALRKPLSVLLYRGWQEGRIHLLHRLRGWSRLAEQVGDAWSDDAVGHVVEEFRPVVLAYDAYGALRGMLNAAPTTKARLLDWARRISAREFEVLGAPVPKDGPWPWHQDWRYGKTWSPRFFRDYDPYEPRSDPFDIKMPWELSRMWFLPAIAQAGALDPERKWIEQISEVLASWESENPVAYSVNWHPMEASMRAITFVVTLEMLLSVDCVPRELVKRLGRLACLHGEFIWRTVEYTDVRGNHYAANVVALLLLGEVFAAAYPPSKRWSIWALPRVRREISLQFCRDGMNFEKSVAYHRFVTELFLLALLVMRRTGHRDTACEARLRKACEYCRLVHRPDGLAPNIGDNDDARALLFDPVLPRNHSPLVDVAAAWFADPSLKLSTDMPAALPWLLGSEGVRQWQSLSDVTPPRASYWASGGVVVARQANNYLWIDVGEVGLHGHGGHGHNDLGSFELTLDGTPVVIDPGCPVYSGDPDLRNRFRSTELHNTLRIDGEEMAPLRGLWEIGDDARPVDVTVHDHGDAVNVRFNHRGYERLPDPVVHERSVRFDPSLPIFECHDRIEGRGTHRVERFLYFSPASDVSVESGHAKVRAGGNVWLIRWNDAFAAVERTRVSPSYGLLEETWRIRLVTETSGPAELWFAISPADNNSIRKGA